MDASSTPRGWRIGLFAVLGGGFCALFLGVFSDGHTGGSSRDAGGPADPRPAEAAPGGRAVGAAPSASARLLGMPGVRAVARKVREVRLLTGDTAAAAAIGRQLLDRVLPEAPHARQKVLLAAFGDADADVRWVAMGGVFRYEPVDARLIKILLVRARDPSPLVQQAATTALAGLRQADPQARVLMERALADAPGPVWAALMHALLNIEASVRHKPLLLASLTSEDVDRRRAAAYGLARIGLGPGNGPYAHADALPPMIQALEDADSEVRMWIAQGLSRMGPEAGPAVPALVRHLTDPARSVADWAKAALGEIGAAALPAVAQVMAAADRDRAAGAAYVLRRVGGPAARTILRRGTGSTDPVIRSRCMMALRDLTGANDDALKLYIDVLAGEDTSALRLALEGLTRLGREAAPAAAAVRRLAKHPDQIVRRKARSILTAIAPVEDD